MNKYLYCLFVLLISLNPLLAQDQLNTDRSLLVELDLKNPSREINDAEAMLQVSGGVAPYTYYWSNKETSMQATKSTV